MNLPTSVEYPVVAIGDLHGQVEWLDKLVAKLERRLGLVRWGPLDVEN